MIEVTERANRLLAKHLEKDGSTKVRIFPKTGECGIHILAMETATPTDSDEVFTHSGVEIIIDKAWGEKAHPIKLDSDGVGFILSARGYYSTAGCGICGFLGCR